MPVGDRNPPMSIVLLSKRKGLPHLSKGRDSRIFQARGERAEYPRQSRRLVQHGDDDAQSSLSAHSSGPGQVVRTVDVGETFQPVAIDRAPMQLFTSKMRGLFLARIAQHQ